MGNKIKTLYILSIIAIIAFLAMQCYWLYSRYEYTLRDYEYQAEVVIANALSEYNTLRPRTSHRLSYGRKIQSSFNMNNDTDSAGKETRKVSVTTQVIDGAKMLGINEKRKLTSSEMQTLEKKVLDSLDIVNHMIEELDATSAPSDGAAWSAMKNFELEVQSPFAAEGLDSILRKDGIDADVSLIVTDSIYWQPVITRHKSILSPRFRYQSPYSELERKAVIIDCNIPTSDVLREMGVTLLIAGILSLFLILCLAWQIRTIVRLTRLDNMRNSFITTMIHELKRPISTLKMCVSGLDNEQMMQDPALRHEMTAEIRAALDNLSAYFSKLRDLTFNNVDQIPLNISTFNLRRFTQDVVGSIPVPGDKQVTIENRIAPELEISSDRTHLANIITNLIENAIKYSGTDVKIDISAETTADGIALRVSDNGYGIADSDRERIFTRFYRGRHSASDIPGMGLGLTYVKLLVDAHGGQISVESREGRGSTFTITLPQ